MSAVAIVVVGFVTVVVVPNRIVGLSSPGRDVRADLAAAVAVVCLLVIAFLLRRLQARKLI